MKTILFYAATLLFSGTAMGQQASVKSQQATSASAAVSKKPGNVQGSGAITNASATEVSANPVPVVEASKKAAARTKTEVNNKSHAALEATTARVESAQELTASPMLKTQADLEASGKAAAVKVDQPVGTTDLSVLSDNKTSTAASINGAQNISTQVRAMKQKKARVRTNGNVSVGSSVRPGSIHASGLIKTSTGLGL